MRRFRFPLLSALVLLAASLSVSFGLTGHVVPFVGSPQEEIVLQSDNAQVVDTEEPEATGSPEVDNDKEQLADAIRAKASKNKERSTEGCPEGFEGNHGQFVSQSTAQPRNVAAHSDCGKPVKSGDKTSSSPDEQEDEDERGHGYGHDKNKNKDD